MTAAPRQLVLDLPHRAAFGAEDFLVSAANEAAVALVDRWPDWPQPCALVVGPVSSGKTHLAHVWCLRSGASDVIAASSLSDNVIGRFAETSALVIEDVDRGVSDERVLFHMLNLAREHRKSLLLTSAVAPGELEIVLPDLRSRLRALPLVRIEPPDEDLLRPVLVKLFSDRQLNVEPHIIEHLARNMERSFATATRVVAEIDREALAARRKVTRALAADVLARLASTDGEG